MNRSAQLCALVAAAWTSSSGARADEPIPKADIFKKIKPATVVVEALGGHIGSGFCVRESGLFITNCNLVDTNKAGEKLIVVVNAGEENQKILKAVVVRRDPELDLALLKIDSEEKFPTGALGTDEKFEELDELVSVGYSHAAERIGSGRYTRAAVDVVTINSLRRNDKKQIERLVFSTGFNLWGRGGPLLSRAGKVVGVAVSGNPKVGTNTTAVPIGPLRRFLDTPEIALTSPPVAIKDKSKSVEFVADVAGLLPLDKPYEVELVVASREGEHRYPMKLKSGKYVVDAAPFRDEGTVRPRVELRFPEGSLAGQTENGGFAVAGKPFTLDEVRAVRFATESGATLESGETVPGAVTGLDTLAVSLGGQTLSAKTKTATELIVTSSGRSRGGYCCTVVAKLRDEEIGRHEIVKHLVGLEPGRTDLLLKGKFVKPPLGLGPTTYLKIASVPENTIGQGKALSFDGNELKPPTHAAGALAAKAGEWSLSVMPPRGETLKVGEYPRVKGFPADTTTAGLNFWGTGRGSPQGIEGKIVVWELELKGDRLAKCAIDFIQYSNGKPEPLVGRLRWNSTFE